MELKDSPSAPTSATLLGGIPTPRSPPASRWAAAAAPRTGRDHGPVLEHRDHGHQTDRRRETHGRRDHRLAAVGAGGVGTLRQLDPLGLHVLVELRPQVVDPPFAPSTATAAPDAARSPRRTASTSGTE